MCQVTRLEVETFVSDVLKETTTLNEIGLDNDDLKPMDRRIHTEHHHEASVIRECIDVLFAFVRVRSSDASFTFEVNGWLERFVSVLLRIGTFKDHRFMLNHVLR